MSCAPLSLPSLQFSFMLPSLAFSPLLSPPLPHPRFLQLSLPFTSGAFPLYLKPSPTTSGSPATPPPSAASPSTLLKRCHLSQSRPRPPPLNYHSTCPTPSATFLTCVSPQSPYITFYRTPLRIWQTSKPKPLLSLVLLTHLPQLHLDSDSEGFYRVFSALVAFLPPLSPLPFLSLPPLPHPSFLPRSLSFVIIAPPPPMCGSHCFSVSADSALCLAALPCTFIALGFISSYPHHALCSPINQSTCSALVANHHSQLSNGHLRTI